MFTLALAQMAHPTHETVADSVRVWAQRAQTRGAQMLVFPECLMTPHCTTPQDFAANAQALTGAFACAMSKIARETGLWIVYTANETNPNNTKPYNTAVVVDANGCVRGSYRKTHLYAAHGVCEHDKMSEGATLFTPLETPFCTLGLGICYDVRFPEVARAAALSGCNVLVFPAAWVAGEHKVQHWETLLRARAIENELFVAGCCRPDNNCIGHSLVVNPQGEVIARAHANEELVVATINTHNVTTTRANMPCFEHRRPALYHTLVE